MFYNTKTLLSVTLIVTIVTVCSIYALKSKRPQMRSQARFRDVWSTSLGGQPSPGMTMYIWVDAFPKFAMIRRICQEHPQNAQQLHGELRMALEQAQFDFMDAYRHDRIMGHSSTDTMANVPVHLEWCLVAFCDYEPVSHPQKKFEFIQYVFRIAAKDLFSEVPMDALLNNVEFIGRTSYEELFVSDESASEEIRFLRKVTIAPGTDRFGNSKVDDDSR